MSINGDVGDTKLEIGSLMKNTKNPTGARQSDFLQIPQIPGMTNLSNGTSADANGGGNSSRNYEVNSARKSSSERQREKKEAVDEYLLNSARGKKALCSIDKMNPAVWQMLNKEDKKNVIMIESQDLRNFNGIDFELFDLLTAEELKLLGDIVQKNMLKGDKNAEQEAAKLKQELAKERRERGTKSCCMHGDCPNCCEDHCGPIVSLWNCFKCC